MGVAANPQQAGSSPPQAKARPTAIVVSTTAIGLCVTQFGCTAPMHAADPVTLATNLCLDAFDFAAGHAAQLGDFHEPQTMRLLDRLSRTYLSAAQTFADIESSSIAHGR